MIYNLIYLVCLQHEVLKQCGLPWELEALLANWLKTEEEHLHTMEIVADRLKREQDKVIINAHRIIQINCITDTG